MNPAKLVGVASVFFEEPLPLGSLLFPAALLGLLALATFALFSLALLAGFPLSPLSTFSLLAFSTFPLGLLAGFAFPRLATLFFLTFGLSLLFFLPLSGGRVGERGKRECGKGQK